MLLNNQWITEEIKEELNGFPGSPVVTNLSANAPTEAPTNGCARPVA